MCTSLIVVSGPSEACSKTLIVDQLGADEPHRAATAHSYTDGKGAQLCRATAS
ncbi:tagatose-6-phosphate kinase-like protein [Leishmania tarentolae]|uniref:Tagatose-6-phosphate kinase-like protein n=1 Tax=Leishmania tarentolae TaxID=5689 RepID=A0A640KCF1_LEITA|nr:tagatose-6-phosphate kinase-like protein [Leishmania tarentolae]